MKVANNGLTITIDGAMGHFPKEFVVSALEKQIPKKVIKTEEYLNGAGEWETEYECATYGNPYIDDSYCGCSGQALDWGEEE